MRFEPRVLGLLFSLLFVAPGSDLRTALAASAAPMQDVCANPLGSANYRLGETPAAHVKRIKSGKWQARVIWRGTLCLLSDAPRFHRTSNGHCLHNRSLVPSIDARLNALQDTNAVDFLAPEGTPVYAVEGGTVCAPPACVFGKTDEEKQDRFSLNTLTIRSDGGQQEYYYTHLGSISVKPGQRVDRGQQVATVGAYQGRNAHVHLAVKRGSACELLQKCAPADGRGCA